MPVSAADRRGPHGGALPDDVRSSHRDEPIDITGQETIYDSKAETFTVKGDAVMTQGGSVLKADEITVFRATRQAVATGNVHLIDPEVELWAKSANIDIPNETLELYDAKVFAKQNVYHLEGEKIRKVQGQNYIITKGFFTTCGCEKGTPDWAIRADQMNVEIGGSGTAKNASFDVLGVPILKFPTGVFPANADRHSGFLASRQGYSGLRGGQYLQPYYLAINKSSDATVALDVESSQRAGGLLEYRLTNGKDDYFWADAAYYNEAIRSDANRERDLVDNQIANTSFPENRYDVIAMARQHLTDNIVAYGDTISTSDSLIMREVNVWTLSRGFGSNLGAIRNAVSHFGLLDSFENGYARVQGTYNQDLIQPQVYALQRLPELLAAGREQFGNLGFADYDVDVANFVRRQGFQGWRFHTNPRFTIPYRLGDWATAYASAGVSATAWDAGGHLINVTPVGQTPPGSKTPQTYNNALSTGLLQSNDLGARAIPFVQAGVSTVIDRIFNVDGTSIEKLKHTVEPFVNYSYVPRIDQSKTPLFDQYDRLQPRSLVEYGYTSRLFAKLADPASSAPDDLPDITPDQSSAAASATEGPYGGNSDQGQGLAPRAGKIMSNGSHVQELAQLTMLQAYDFSHDVTAAGSRISDFEGLVTVFPTSIASFGGQLDYNPRNHAGITYGNAYMSFQPPWQTASSRLYMGRALQGSFAQFAYSYVRPQNAVLPTTTRNASQYLTMRAYTDVFDRVGVYFAPSYDFSSSRLLEAEYGVRLKSVCDCWAADVGVVDSFNPDEVQVQVQITLGGLGSFGRSPFGRNPFQQYGLAGQPTGVLPHY